MVNDCDIADNVLETALRLLSRKTGRTVCPEASLMDDLGMDSLDITEVMMELEDRYGFGQASQPGKMKTAGDLARYARDNAGM